MKSVATIVGCILACAFAWMPLLTHAQPKTLPKFSLPDPQGGMHSSATLVKNGMVIVVTAPTLHDKGAQEGWNKYLSAARGNCKASFVFLEDLTASLFKGEAKSEMHKSWKTGDIPILLVDSTGNTRKAFGVARDGTEVFVYDKSGKFVYSYGGSPSAASAATIWGKLK
jgi:hypothetical protein